VTALTLPQLHYQHPPVKLLELGAEMLGWILGAQPTATTQYPIVHQPRYFEDKDKDNNKEKNEDKDFLSVFL